MINVLSVSDFLEQINGVIAGEFVIEGEIAQYKISQGKWIYFDLKDDKAILPCFATTYTLKQPLEDGMKVRVIGYPRIYEKTGRFSLTVQKVELVGEGAIKRAFLLLKNKLETEGLFAPERKRPLPELPTRIGVIASRDSAAWGDFQRILNNRWGGVEVDLYHAAVQGAEAVTEIVAAFEYFNSHHDKYDLVVLIRGGGSMEDLAAFNSEETVRAVYGSKVPVVCGVGHERDETLCDYAADRRASTPSNAAEIIVPDRRDFIAQLEFGLDNMLSSMEHAVTKARRAVEQSFYVVASGLERPIQDSRRLLERFGRAFENIQNSISKQKEFVIACERLLQNINPKRILQRGYSIARDVRGQIVRAAAKLKAGDNITVEFGDGTVGVEVVGGGVKKEVQKRLL